VSSEDELRRALGRFATGVALVTAPVDGVNEGLVVNSFTSVSLVPPLVAFCPSRASLTWARMRRAGRFGINVLPEGSERFVRHAARPGTERVALVEHTVSTSGVARLDCAVAFLECAVTAEHAAGDHTIVVGRVEALACAAGTPLVFWRGGYGTVDAALSGRA
jgi:flavin reductase (DIM6/NTAB) family NADH-FMN oxidoreductase RutF